MGLVLVLPAASVWSYLWLPVDQPARHAGFCTAGQPPNHLLSPPHACRNQTRGQPKAQKRFINDTIRNDFHKRFLERYVR